MKKKLRQDYREIRRLKISKLDHSSIKTSIRNLLKISPSEVFLLYASNPEEFPTRELFEKLKQLGKRTYFPRLKGSEMNFFEVHHWDELQASKWTLEPKPEPTKLWRAETGTVITPGLVFNRWGQRIGYGKAYYDRFLHQHPKLLRIGLALNEQIHLHAWEDESHDEVMDFIVCPAGIWASPRT